MVKRHRSSDFELETILPALHGALGSPTPSEHLAPLLHMMLRHSATNAQEYLQEVDGAIAQLRQLLVTRLHEDGENHQQDLMQFDQDAAGTRNRIVSILESNHTA